MAKIILITVKTMYGHYFSNFFFFVFKLNLFKIIHFVQFYF